MIYFTRKKLSFSNMMYKIKVQELKSPFYTTNSFVTNFIWQIFWPCKLGFFDEFAKIPNLHDQKTFDIWNLSKKIWSCKRSLNEANNAAVKSSSLKSLFEISMFYTYIILFYNEVLLTAAAMVSSEFLNFDFIIYFVSLLNCLYYKHDYYTHKNAQVVTSLRTSCNKLCSHCLFLVCCNKFGTSC